jgi:L-ascorbate metabolism protein UlaG (beta-lactamase superfamily)
MNSLRIHLMAWLGLLALLCAVCSCATRAPVIHGMTLVLAKADPSLATNEPAYKTTLQVHWLGTACYLFQLGDKAIFTDPFLTHQSLARVLLGRSITSDPVTASNKLANLCIPQAMFVSHSHYDHLLDAAECLKQPGWSGVPVYGSVSTRNVLSGYGDQFTNLWRIMATNTSWQTVVDGIRYKAIPATHGRQVPLLPLIYAGKVANRLPRSPRASDFKVGEDYALLFELSNAEVAYTIYFVGAAHHDQEGLPDESVKSVDVAVICVPTWKLSTGYPSNIIYRLQPRHIIASHYDNFFQVNNKPTEVVALADLNGFLFRSQQSSDYYRFKDILLPSVGSVLLFKPEAAQR